MNDRIRPGTLVVILDSGFYYGKIAEFRSFTGAGIICACPVGGRDSLRTAWRYREAGKYAEQS